MRKDSTPDLRIPVFVWMVIGAALISGLALWLSFDPWGIGLVHDSVFYISGADNLSAGRGLVWNAGGEELRPLIHFPPGYSTVLAAFGGSALQAANVIQIIALATTVVLIGGIIYLGSGNGTVTALGAAVVAASPVLFERYLDLRSEPLFMVFLLGSIVSLLRFLQTGNSRWLWGASVLTAFAGAFRYAGLAALSSGVLVILIAKRSVWRDRASTAAKFALIPTVLFAMLALRNLRLSGSATNRVFAFHPPSVSVFRQGAVAISEWILPTGIDRVLSLALLSVIGIAALILVRYRDGSSILPRVLAVYALIYFASLIVSLTLFDASIRLDNRILLPLYIYFLIAVFTILGSARVPKGAIAFASIALIAIYGIRTADLVSNARTLGRGFTSKAWQSSPTIQRLTEASPSGSIYSNEALAIYSLLGVSAFPAPEKTDPVKGGPRTEYEGQLNEMRLRLSEPESALVLFHPDQLREGMPTLNELTEGLVASVQAADGAIYSDPGSTFWP